MRLLKEFKTLNYVNRYLFEKILISSKENSNNKKIKYLNRYMYALNNSLDIKFSDEYDCPIWQLWLQGGSKMPSIVKTCINSIKKYNPEREIILLTNENLNKHIKLPKYIKEKYARGIISHAHYADIVRLFLLCKYGGTWIDATVLMTGKMPEYIVKSDFFVFKDLASSLIKENTTLEQFTILNNKIGTGAFTNSISFIHSKNKNEILVDTLKVMLEYWKHENRAIDYLFFSYFLTMVIFNNQNYKMKFINMPYNLTTIEYGTLQRCLFEHFDEKLFENIKKITPIHKLVYKHQEKDIYKDSFLNYFLSKDYNY